MVKRRRAKVLAAAMMATACGGVALTGSAGAESDPPPSTFPVRPLVITFSPPVGRLASTLELTDLFGVQIEPVSVPFDVHEATQLALEPLPGPFPAESTQADTAPESAPADDPVATPAAAEPSAPASASETETETETPRETQTEPSTTPPAADETEKTSSTKESPGPSDAALAQLRACESGGDYTIVSYGGWYRGAYQFDQETWDSVASRWQPALVGIDPAQSSPSDQDAMARALYAERGWSPWPACGIGL
jgi:hypothetical protein